MMDAISKSISEVRYNIPQQILDATFGDPRTSNRGVIVNTDTRIREEIVYSRVMTDCNLYGAQQLLVPLNNLCPTQVDPYTAIYQIPSTMLHGRSITSVLGVSQGLGNGTFGINDTYPNDSSAINQALQQVLDSNTPIPYVNNVYVRLVAENTIYVEYQDIMPQDAFLRCMVTHDTTLSNLNTASYLEFSKLVVLATKAHIYQNNIIRLDVGQLHAGMQLGTFKEIIDSYSDANELYYTHLEERWRKVSLLNDPLSHRRHLKMLTGGGR